MVDREPRSQTRRGEVQRARDAVGEFMLEVADHAKSKRRDGAAKFVIDTRDEYLSEGEQEVDNSIDEASGGGSSDFNLRYLSRVED